VSRAARTAWPLALAALVSCALLLVTAAVQQTNGALPLVWRVTQLALAGGAAYLLDDAAASVTTVVPQGRWRRRAPVLVVGVAVLAVAWLAVLVVLQWRDARPPVVESSGELLVMALVTLALAALGSRLGDPEPGVVIAPLVVMLGLFLVIAGSILRAPVYLTDAEPTLTRTAAWSAAATLALVTIVVAGSERATPRRRRRPARPRPDCAQPVPATPRGGADRPPG
jgi:hypothetical protein